jgi:hypothetical protein
LTVVGATVRL